VAVGGHPDFETAAASMTSSRQSFAPDPVNHDIYRRMNETAYRAIHSATDAILEQSFSIFH
jgi:sugar (pentulose or hexulose) kinase